MKFAEGTFGTLVIGLHPTFQDDFRSRGERKPCDLAAHDSDRLFENRAYIVVLAHAKRDLDAGNEVTERVTAGHDSNREGLAGLLVLLILNAAMLSLDHVDGDMITIMDHRAVGADVHPIRIEVSRDDRAAGADVAAAIQFVPEGHWKDQHIDVYILLDVFEDGAALHDDGVIFCCFGLPDARLAA